MISLEDRLLHLIGTKYGHGKRYIVFYWWPEAQETLADITRPLPAGKHCEHHDCHRRVKVNPMCSMQLHHFLCLSHRPSCSSRIGMEGMTSIHYAQKMPGVLNPNAGWYLFLAVPSPTFCLVLLTSKEDALWKCSAQPKIWRLILYSSASTLFFMAGLLVPWSVPHVANSHSEVTLFTFVWVSKAGYHRNSHIHWAMLANPYFNGTRNTAAGCLYMEPGSASQKGK